MKSFSNFVKKILIAVPSILLLLFIGTNYTLYFIGFDYSNHPLLTTIITLVFALVLLSYIKCVVSDPGSIPSYFDFLPLNSIVKLSNNDFSSDMIPVYASFCYFCQRNRPARAHHCLICNKCVLKRDHHCI